MPLIPGGNRKKRRQEPPPSGRALYTPSDFTYEGTYVNRNGDNNYGQCLTHRYVGGQLRLSYLKYLGGGSPVSFGLEEIVLNAEFGAAAYPTIVTDATYYTNWQPGVAAEDTNINAHTSLWWEESEQRFWSCSAGDYPQGSFLTTSLGSIYTRQLPVSGGGNCINTSGFFPIEGIGMRAQLGKIQKIPQWFRTANGVGPYIHLGGGYTSLANQGLGPSFGPMFIALPQLHGNYTPNFDKYTTTHSVPATDVHILADHRSGVGTPDWYGGSYASRTKDRGVRLLPLNNYNDGGQYNGDPAGACNGTNCPLFLNGPPAPWPTGNWLSPCLGDSLTTKDPDGWGRWGWGDTYSDTGQWIDNDAGTRLKHGIVCIAQMSTGSQYYFNSSGYTTDMGYELHIFHPDDLAAVKAGTLDAWKLRPRYVRILSELDSYIVPVPFGSIGATFDDVSGKLFIQTFLGTSDTCWIHQYSVAS